MVDFGAVGGKTECPAVPLKLKYRLGSFWKPQLIMSREGRLQCMAGGSDTSKSGNVDIMNYRQADKQTDSPR